MKVKRIISGLSAIAIAIASFLPIQVKADGYWPDTVEVQAPAAIVIDVDTGTILYEKNVHETFYPASITKVLTALCVLENSDINDQITFSHDAVYLNEYDSSHIARDVGEVMTVEQCLYALMLASANECAWALGEHAAGDIDSFIQMMNDKAKELGCQDSHFVNPNGLHDADHYVSAYDMGLIAAAAYKNPKFAEICGTEKYVIPPTNVHSEETYLTNHHKMLHYYKTSKFIYPYCVGGKTGYTDPARFTLVTYAQKDGMTIAVVVLNEANDVQWVDTAKLCDYVFDNFSVYNVASNAQLSGGTKKDLEGKLSQNIDLIKIDNKGTVILPKTVEFSDAQSILTAINDPANPSIVGRLSYSYAGRNVGGADIRFESQSGVEFPFANIAEEDGGGTYNFTTVDYKPFLYGFLIIVAVVVVVIFFAKQWGAIYLFFRKRINYRNNRKPKSNLKKIDHSYRSGNPHRKRRRRRW